jgi:hypothetical protein
MLIQCKKRNYVPPAEMNELREAAGKYNAAIVIVTRNEKRGLDFIPVSKDG